MMKEAGGDVIGLDWHIDLDVGWQRLGGGVGVQGNLDPIILLAPSDVIERRVADILERADGRPGHIFNLGHGIIPETPEENVRVAVDAGPPFECATAPGLLSVVDVVVVGGGIAGLATALALMDEGFGGRIHGAGTRSPLGRQDPH